MTDLAPWITELIERGVRRGFIAGSLITGALSILAAWLTRR